MASRREVDPEARRLLAELDHIEAGPWPAGLEAYAETLLGLAVRCEEKAGKAEMYRWLLRERVRVIYASDGKQAAARLDAAAVIAPTSAGLLLQWRAALDPRQRPNLRSMTGALIAWRGKDAWTSNRERHWKREVQWTSAFDGRVCPRQETRVIADEVCRFLAAGGPPEEALLRLALGESIAEAARRTGASRQQVYRARRRLFEHLDISPNGRPVGERQAKSTHPRSADAADLDDGPETSVRPDRRVQHEGGAHHRMDCADQLTDIHRGSSVRSPDPTPVRPRPTPHVRRPMFEATRPTPTTGLDQGRIEPRTTGDRPAGQSGHGLRVRRAALSDPVRGRQADRMGRLEAIR